jgi:hypothetical protein
MAGNRGVLTAEIPKLAAMFPGVDLYTITETKKHRQRTIPHQAEEELDRFHHAAAGVSPDEGQRDVLNIRNSSNRWSRRQGWDIVMNQLVSRGGTVCDNSADTDLCGGSSDAHPHRNLSATQQTE